MALEYKPGQNAAVHFLSFAGELAKILPVVFVLVGLFEVWVPRKTIEKHLGSARSIRAYIWVLILAMTTIGGLFVALPIAQSLEGKGASKPVVFTYLTGATIVRLPMTIFEATFLGIKFTAVRWMVAIGLTLLSSFMLSRAKGQEPIFLDDTSEDLA
jgi:uncharacterized membrane protein YraQ (UPF0718 family)